MLDQLPLRYNNNHREQLDLEVPYLTAQARAGILVSSIADQLDSPPGGTASLIVASQRPVNTIRRRIMLCKGEIEGSNSE